MQWPGFIQRVAWKPDCSDTSPSLWEMLPIKVFEFLQLIEENDRIYVQTKDNIAFVIKKTSKTLVCVKCEFCNYFNALIKIWLLPLWNNTHVQLAFIWLATAGIMSYCILVRKYFSTKFWNLFKFGKIVRHPFLLL